jgi:hypothetical protein
VLWCGIRGMMGLEGGKEVVDVVVEDEKKREALGV